MNRKLGARRLNTPKRRTKQAYETKKLKPHTRKLETGHTVRTEKQLTAIPLELLNKTGEKPKATNVPLTGSIRRRCWIWGIATWKIKWYSEDNIGKDTARGIAVLRAGNPTGNYKTYKTEKLGSSCKNNNKESIENKQNQSKEYNLENIANKKEKVQKILTLKIYVTGQNVGHVATYKI